MKQIIPEVYVKNCAEALSFYRELFGGDIKNLQMSDSLPAFAGQKGKVVHAELHVNSRCVFYFVDIFDAKRKNTGNMTLVLHLDNMEEITRLYEVLAHNGTVGMPLQETYWGAWHAIVTDSFGAPWALNYSA